DKNRTTADRDLNDFDNRLYEDSKILFFTPGIEIAPSISEVCEYNLNNSKYNNINSNRNSNKFKVGLVKER
ncbi:18095_t:CDS:1, partial [Dentiscutata erythropus]